MVHAHAFYFERLSIQVKTIIAIEMEETNTKTYFMRVQNLIFMSQKNSCLVKRRAVGRPKAWIENSQCVFRVSQCTALLEIFTYFTRADDFPTWIPQLVC